MTDEQIDAVLEAVKPAWWDGPGNRGTYRFARALLAAPHPAQSAPNEGGSEPVAEVQGSDRVIGAERRSLAWMKGIDSFSFAPGTKLYAAPQPVASPAPASGALLEYVLQDDLHNRLTPRVIDIAYTAFMQAKEPNAEDGGPSDWFNDTRPIVKEAIAKLRKDLLGEGSKILAASQAEKGESQ